MGTINRPKKPAAALGLKVGNSYVNSKKENSLHNRTSISKQPNKIVCIYIYVYYIYIIYILYNYHIIIIYIIYKNLKAM